MGKTYESIASKLKAPPKNTAELMKLIAYSGEVESVTLGELQEELQEILSYILFLSDYTALTQPELRQNTFTFLWYTKMRSVLVDNKKLIDKKTVEFQEFLKVNTTYNLMEYFLERRSMMIII